MNEQELLENQSSEPLPLEEQIGLELVKHNYTEAKLKEFEEYLKLEIVDNDKESYLLVKDKRKEVKAWRVAVEKFCKYKREDALKTQKAWVAKENELVEKISKVEDYLEKQEKEYEAEVAKEKERRKRQQEEQLINRQQILSTMGALYSDGFFALGEVSFELSLIKECEPDIWEESILPKYQEAFDIINAERKAEAERKLAEEAELKRQQEVLERRQRELEEKEAALKAAQTEQERKQREEEEKKAAEAKAAREAKQKVRMDQLTSLGLKFDFSDNCFKGYTCDVSQSDTLTYDEEKWSRTIDDITAIVAHEKEKEEQKRQAEIEAQKEAARRNEIRKQRISILHQYEDTWEHGDIADLSDDTWELLVSGAKARYEEKQREKWEAEQEEKRQKEEADRQAKMEAAKDKEKWQEMMTQVNGIEVYEMRSSQYRQKAKKFRDLLTLLKQLDNGQD